MNTLQLNTLNKCELGENYLALGSNIEDKDFGAIFQTLSEMNGASYFWLGDLLLQLETRKGAHYTKEFESQTFDPQTLRTAKAVCRRFPRDKRARVSFSHHRESLIEAKIDGITDIELALKYLRQAEELGQSVKDMRKSMRLAIKATKEQPVSMKDIINDADYIRAREAVFSIRRYLEQLDSKSHPIAKGSILAEIHGLYEFALVVCKKGN